MTDDFKNYMDDEFQEFVKEKIEDYEGKSVHVLPKELVHKVYTENRVEIIEELKNESFESKRDLARSLDRDFKNLNRDLDVLFKLGIVSFEEAKGRKMPPVLDCDKVVVEPL